eukprot:1154067-Pelagomonas_calceolata.AAC.5
MPALAALFQLYLTLQGGGRNAGESEQTCANTQVAPSNPAVLPVWMQAATSVKRTHACKCKSVPTYPDNRACRNAGCYVGGPIQRIKHNDVLGGVLAIHNARLVIFLYSDRVWMEAPSEAGTGLEVMH